MPRKSFADARAAGPVEKVFQPVIAAPDFDLSLLYDLDEDPIDPALKALCDSYPIVHHIDLGRPFDGVDTSVPK